MPSGAAGRAHNVIDLAEWRAARRPESVPVEVLDEMDAAARVYEALLARDIADVNLAAAAAARKPWDGIEADIRSLFDGALADHAVRETKAKYAAGDDLVAAERRQALREALAELPASRRDLLMLLLADPPLAYAEISARLGIPIGSIGPTRARALEQLRRTQALQDLGEVSA